MRPRRGCSLFGVVVIVDLKMRVVMVLLVLPMEVWRDRKKVDDKRIHRVQVDVDAADRAVF